MKTTFLNGLEPASKPALIAAHRLIVGAMSAFDEWCLDDEALLNCDFFQSEHKAEPESGGGA